MSCGKKPIRSHKMLKKWSKRFLYALAGLLLLLVLLFFTRPLYLSDKFLIRKAEEEIHRATGTNLEIASGRIRFLKGATLREITWRDSSGQQMFSAEEIALHYRLLPLLKRRFVIEEITVKNPRIDLAALQEYFTPSPADTSAQITTPTKARSDLPVSIEIRNFSVENLRLEYHQIMPAGQMEAEMTDLNINLHDFHMKSSEIYSGTFQAGCEDSLYVRFSREDLQLQWAVELQSSLHGKLNQDSAQVDFAAKMHPSIWGSSPRARVDEVWPEINTSFRAGFRQPGTLEVKQLEFRVGNLLSLAAEGSAADLQNEGLIEFRMREAQMDLGKVWSLTEATAPLFGLEESIAGRQLAGKLIISNSSLSGKMAAHPSLAVELNGALQGGAYADIKEKTSIQGIEFTAALSGDLLPLDSLKLTTTADSQVDSATISAGNDSTVFISQFALELSGKIGPNWKYLELQTAWSSNGPWEVQQRGNFVLQADRINLSDVASSPNLRLKGGASFDNLYLQKIVAEGYAGNVSAALDVEAQGLQDIDIQLGLYGVDVAANLGGTALLFPEWLLTLNANAELRSDFSGMDFQQASAEISPYAHLDFVGLIDDRPAWEIGQIELELDLPEILPVLKPLLPVDLQEMAISGKPIFTGSLRAIADSSGWTIDQNIAGRCSELSVKIPAYQLAGDSISAETSFEGSMQNLQISGAVSIGQLSLQALRDDPYRDLSLGLRGDLKEAKSLKDASLWLEWKELGLEAQGYGSADLAEQGLTSQWEIQIHFQAEQAVQPVRDFSLWGLGGAELTLELGADSSLQAAGRMTSENLHLLLGEQLQMDGLELKLPFKQELKLDALGWQVPENMVKSTSMADGVIYSAVEHQFAQTQKEGQFHIDSLRASGYQVENLEGLVNFEQGRLSLPRLSLQAYGGTILGAGEVVLNSLDPQDLQYKIELSAEGINSARLPGIKTTSKEEADIAAFARFNGRGINPEEDFNLTGGVDITRIGRRVADNLLKFLDPNETDPSIQTYRGYLRRGWGVKVFSFEVKDDFVYASITPAKPPLTKPDMFVVSRLVGLGKAITFGRVPLKFFLSSAEPTLP